jgi:hypothetical protein
MNEELKIYLEELIRDQSAKVARTGANKGVEHEVAIEVLRIVLKIKDKANGQK